MTPDRRTYVAVQRGGRITVWVNGFSMWLHGVHLFAFQTESAVTVRPGWRR